MAEIDGRTLGLYSAVSGALSLIFYELYRNGTKTAQEIKHLTVWEPDDHLVNHLCMQDNQSLAYAAIEGVVTDLGRTLSSRHGNQKGVVLRSRKETHVSKWVDGSWKDITKTDQDITEVVPFAIVKSIGDHQLKVEVKEPKLATQLENDLKTTYDHFQPNDGLVNVVKSKWLKMFGTEIIQGQQETEQMLLNETCILGIGQIFLENKHIKLGPPKDLKRTYLITSMGFNELVRYYQSRSTGFKVFAIFAACISGGLLVFIAARYKFPATIRSWNQMVLDV